MIPVSTQVRLKMFYRHRWVIWLPNSTLDARLYLGSEGRFEFHFRVSVDLEQLAHEDCLLLEPLERFLKDDYTKQQEPWPCHWAPSVLGGPDYSFPPRIRPRKPEFRRLVG